MHIRDVTCRNILKPTVFLKKKVLNVKNELKRNYFFNNTKIAESGFFLKMEFPFSIIQWGKNGFSHIKESEFNTKFTKYKYLSSYVDIGIHCLLRENIDE